MLCAYCMSSEGQQIKIELYVKFIAKALLSLFV